MADVFDIQIIMNSLFIGIFNSLQYTEKEIKNNIFNQNEILIDRIKQFKNDDIINFINNKFSNLIEEIKNLLDKNFDKPLTPVSKENGIIGNNKKRKGRNSELTDGKKYCNCPRTRNRGNCKTIIYNYEKYCKIHINKSNNIIINVPDNGPNSNIVDNKEDIKLNDTNKNQEICENGASIDISNDKKKKKSKKILSDNNNFDYNYILKNKKSQLFEEDGKIYTYNLYEQKIISDAPKGIYCDYCGYTRYNSSPCIFKNCKNRKYGDFEFKIYKKINGKELESKYNKFYEKINEDIDNDDSGNTSSDDDY